MPKRIPFHVVYATSEDSAYPACELNAQGPAARGWRSVGAPPHELLLRLTSVASVHKLQLLAHHQLIPCSVEVLVSGGLVSEGAATPCGATYTSVGRVTLACPAPQARTRELRSAALPEPTIARFVKLKLSGPHPPATDDDQVALMAVNVLGEEVEDLEKSPVSNKELCYSPYDDLAFVMYVDNEIADLVRSLDEKKRAAVCEERFEYARRLKSAGAALAAAGVRIGRWRLRKRTAAARDDFELARCMRDRIADATTGIKEDPALCRLFEEEGPDSRNDSSMPQEYDFSHHLSPSVAAGALSLDIPSPVPPVDQPAEHLEDEADVPLSPILQMPEEPQPEPQHFQIQSPHVQQFPIQPPQSTSEELQEEILRNEEAQRREEIQRKEDSLRREEIQRREDIQRKEEIQRREEIQKREEIQRREEIQKREEEEMRKETDSPRRSITPNAANGTLVRRRNKSAGPRSTFEAYEERLLPALRHSHTNEYLREAREEECSGGGSASSHARAPHKLNERERKQAALPILIFGYPIVEKFYSKNYLDKEEGLARLRAELTSPSNGSTKTSPNKTARAAALLLQRSLRDKVFSVYSQANEVLKTLFLEFVPGRVCAAEVGRCLEKLLPELLRACGDPAPRVHSTAQHTVLTVADCPQVRALHVIPQQLVRPVAASMHPRLALSRLQMLEQLILSHGISTDKNSGLTVRRLGECGAAGAQHAAGSVRAAAERILLAAYARSPRVVRAQLPPDDAVTRRNLIYRHLFQQFDRIDMQKMLNQAPTEEQLLNGDQSEHSVVETASVAQSTRSATTSGMTSSFGMTSSLGATSSYSLKSMTSSVSGVTLAPSSLSGSYTTSKSKSSLKKSPTKRYTPSRAVKDFANYPCYNKLRLDSAVSPKHSPRSSAVEKVHFQDKSEEQPVVYRRTNRNAENRHSMIHYDHENSKPQMKERPITVYEPLHIDYRDSPSLGSPKNSRTDVRSMDSLPMDSPQLSRIDLRCDSDSRSLDSPKVKAEYYREAVLESPKLVSGLRNLHLDDSQMDESGYYSPGRRQQVGVSETHFEAYERGTGDVSSDTTPEPVCNTTCTWCGRRVRADGLEAHYWRRCVLLARCPHCRVALEARVLHAHLLEECSMGEGSWKACAKCGAALPADEGDYHANCIPLGMDEWKCPYCLTNVLARDLPWQRHLMQCPRNPRLSKAT
ncbi:centrosomal protein of 104 kDa isoform X1 [Choristoneura fumiferana]|uniref:centrosomal protein of 104 kDa isoform X1 n=1 Tax=Choristoneura fumiferana TaxID=7141 RepID=UPI003D157081